MNFLNLDQSTLLDVNELTCTHQRLAKIYKRGMTRVFEIFLPVNRFLLTDKGQTVLFFNFAWRS